MEGGGEQHVDELGVVSCVALACFVVIGPSPTLRCDRLAHNTSMMLVCSVVSCVKRNTVEGNLVKKDSDTPSPIGLVWCCEYQLVNT